MSFGRIVRRNRNSCWHDGCKPLRDHGPAPCASWQIGAASGRRVEAGHCENAVGLRLENTARPIFHSASHSSAPSSQNRSVTDHRCPSKCPVEPLEVNGSAAISVGRLPPSRVKTKLGLNLRSERRERTVGLPKLSKLVNKLLLNHRGQIVERKGLWQENGIGNARLSVG